MTRGPGEARARLSLVLALLVAVTLTAPPAGAQGSDGGTITATVTVADQVCVTINAMALDFGVLDFADSGSSEAYEVASCSTGEQELFASGSDAANADDTVLWGLVSGEGSRAVDEFSVDADLAERGTAWLTSDAVSVGIVGAEEAAAATHTLWTPPTGSAGAGETLSFELTWLATLAD